MKFTSTLPEKDGDQFVVVWIFKGDIWSDTFQIVDGRYMVYNIEYDNFIVPDFLPWDEIHEHIDIKTYIMSGETPDVTH